MVVASKGTALTQNSSVLRIARRFRRTAAHLNCWGSAQVYKSSNLSRAKSEGANCLSFLRQFFCSAKVLRLTARMFHSPAASCQKNRPSRSGVTRSERELRAFSVVHDLGHRYPKVQAFFRNQGVTACSRHASTARKPSFLGAAPCQCAGKSCRWDKA